MRNVRTLVPAVITAVALAAGGSAVALAGAGPTSASGPVAGSASSSVAGLLAGSYRSEFGRLSVGGKPQVVSQEAPTLSGKARLGSTLRVVDGTWKPAVVTLTYSWFAGEKMIDGADGASYTPGASDVGKVLSVQVTANKRKYRPVTVVESAGKVAPGRINVSSDPKIKGTAKVGKTLNVTSGSWSVPGVSVSYVWSAGNKVVSTSKKYDVKKNVQGKVLEVEVTAAKDRKS
uniref:hypothetical protein n=1 Tax=Nocardioides sp. TaxID=35761 RepID=UPI002B27C1D5